VIISIEIVFMQFLQPYCNFLRKFFVASFMNFHPAFFLAEVFDLEASIPPSGNARFGFVAEETCWWP
jgi:hypothetical protein